MRSFQQDYVSHKIMFYGWNKMMLALEQLQEVEKQVIYITKALCRGRFKSLKIGFYVQWSTERRLTWLFSIMRNDACLFDHFGISVDWKYGALTTTRTGPIFKFRWEALSAEAKDQTGLLTSTGGFTRTKLCLHSHFVKMAFNSEQVEVWIKT